jgi:hypothetical protein
MLAMYVAALSHGPNPDVMASYGTYALNVLGDTELALQLWQDASAQHPRDPTYHANVVKLLIVLGRYDEVASHIATIRSLGKFGQYESLARQLEQRAADQAKRENQPSH